MNIRSSQKFILFLLFTIIPFVAEAHVINNEFSGFSEGLAHPLSGIDHILAMLSIGLLASQSGKNAGWILLSFITFMLVGLLVGLEQISIPFVEIAIAFSLVMSGLLLTKILKAYNFLLCIFISFFAIFHGHAHGSELIDINQWLKYSFGLMISTILLCLVGFFTGLTLNKTNIKSKILQFSGIIVSLAGGILLATITMN